jgi:GNAT superfamily N-acetyltransferase
VIVVRPVAPDDVDLVLRTLTHRPRERHLERLGLQDVGDAAYLVAWDGPEPVGHALFKRRAARIAPEVEDLFVIPERRNRGVGTALLRELERLARTERFTCIALAVELANVDARRLYDREGFVDTGLPPFDIEYRNLAGKVVHVEPAVQLVKAL